MQWKRRLRSKLRVIYSHHCEGHRLAWHGGFQECPRQSSQCLSASSGHPCRSPKEAEEEPVRIPSGSYPWFLNHSKTQLSNDGKEGFYYFDFFCLVVVVWENQNNFFWNLNNFCSISFNLGNKFKIQLFFRKSYLHILLGTDLLPDPVLRLICSRQVCRSFVQPGFSETSKVSIPHATS